MIMTQRVRENINKRKAHDIKNDCGMAITIKQNKPNESASYDWRQDEKLVHVIDLKKK